VFPSPRRLNPSLLTYLHRCKTCDGDAGYFADFACLPYRTGSSISSHGHAWRTSMASRRSHLTSALFRLSSWKGGPSKPCKDHYSQGQTFSRILDQWRSFRIHSWVGSLRSLTLSSAPFPELPKTTIVHKQPCCSSHYEHTRYISPEAMIAGLSSATRLEKLHLSFHSP
jgi:hypothetical protein